MHGNNKFILLQNSYKGCIKLSMNLARKVPDQLIHFLTKLLQQ